MPNPYYLPTANPGNFSARLSSVIRAELDLIEDAFDKLPILSGASNRLTVVNSGETALVVTTGALSLAGTLTFSGGFETQMIPQGSTTLALPPTNGALTYDKLFPGFISNLTIANSAGDTVNDISIERGSCASQIVGPPITIITMPALMTKQLDVSWAKGSAQGGRCSPALADGTWHVFVVLLTDGDTDACFDDNVSGTNVTAATGSSRYRRIGSILRTAAAGGIVQFVQTGSLFTLITPTQDVSTTNPGTGVVTATLGVPTGLTLHARISALVSDATSSVDKTLLLKSTVSSSSSSPTLLNPANGVAVMVSSLMAEIMTNTSAQINYTLSVSDADITVKIATHAWTDHRGKYIVP